MHFLLNEAVPESQKDHELLAKVRATSAHSSLMALDDPPFQDGFVSLRHRQDGVDSIVMFSFQAAAILSAYPKRMSSVREKGGYSGSQGKFEGRPFVGLTSGDRKRVLLVTSDRQQIIDMVASALIVRKSPMDKIPHATADHAEAVSDLIPESAELLFVRVRTAEQAFAVLAKYTTPYLEEM